MKIVVTWIRFSKESVNPYDFGNIKKFGVGEM